MGKRKLQRGELMLFIYPAQAVADSAIGEQEVHVFRYGLATGKAIPACKQGEWLYNRGFGYWQMPVFAWITEQAPMCETCKARLVAEGLLTPVSNTGVNSGPAGGQP